MNYSDLKQSVLGMLSEKFPTVTSSIETTQYGGTITSFILKFANEHDLDTLWQEMISAIAFYFQSKLDSDFEKWNLYAFFLVPGAVGKDIKYKIENDPVSSRKIVVDNYDNEPTSTIIGDHITNDSLSLVVVESNAAGTLIKNPVIWEELQKLAPKTSSKKKKSNEPYIVETLEAIEKRLRS